jgi:hypothetical protein
MSKSKSSSLTIPQRTALRKKALIRATSAADKKPAKAGSAHKNRDNIIA